jgi:hypothetical protein
MAHEQGNDVQVTIRLPASWLEEADKLARRARPVPAKRVQLLRAAIRVGLDKLSKGG